MKSKIKISDCFFTVLRIWGIAWLAFLITDILLIIWVVCGGINPNSLDNDMFIKNFIRLIGGMVFGFVILTLIQSRNDRAERLSLKESIIYACCSVGLYMIIWYIAYLFNANNMWISVLGFDAACLFGVDSNNLPTFFAMFISSFIFGIVYIGAIVLGTGMARRRRQKNLEE